MIVERKDGKWRSRHWTAATHGGLRNYFARVKKGTPMKGNNIIDLGGVEPPKRSPSKL